MRGRTDERKKDHIEKQGEDQIVYFLSQGAGVKVYGWSGVTKHINFKQSVKCLDIIGDKLYCGCSGFSIQGHENRWEHSDILYAGGTSIDGTTVKVFSMTSRVLVGSLSGAFDIHFHHELIRQSIGTQEANIAHLSLLGYDPRVYYRGRGAFESMGAGLAMAPGDIAFKSNFATLDEKTGVVTSRRADRHFEEEGPILCAARDKMKLPSFPEYEVRVRYATEHRCGVVVKGPKLSGNISGTDPLKDNRLLLEAQPLDNTEEAKHTAKVPAFEKNHGLRPCMVAPTKIIAGLGLSLGIDILEASGATGDYRTLLTSKATTIAKALSAPMRTCPNVFVPGEDEHKPGVSDGYDFGFLHIKAIDEAGHDKASVFKVKGLEAVDKAIGQLARLLWEAESTVGGESVVLQTSLDSFPLPTVEAGDDLSSYVAAEEEISQPGQAFSGDSVWRLNEIVAARVQLSSSFYHEAGRT
ncbi:hypothetical protein L1987_61181 [Smallanthus sonchifolius]|uniref:Uncharacterized protein n=1 Tax=Smallanthus sonchifolius TaxID=185202 RepID=A0ACB9DB06_9ASTR|nr:hypothetical protein L1987_61181 [Smallanthus sonchifolius]